MKEDLYVITTIGGISDTIIDIILLVRIQKALRLFNLQLQVLVMAEAMLVVVVLALAHVLEEEELVVVEKISTILT